MSATKSLTLSIFGFSYDLVKLIILFQSFNQKMMYFALHPAFSTVKLRVILLQVTLLLWEYNFKNAEEAEQSRTERRFVHQNLKFELG